MRRWLQGLLVIGGVLLLLAGCAVNPVTGEREFRLLSESEEVAIGEQQYGRTQQAMGGAYTAEPDLVAFVEEVGQRVAAESDRPGLPYEFVVLNDSTPNAWALPGGKIAINRGLLLEMETEAELAAVLGHEITHAAARHGAQRVERGLMLQAGVAAVGLATRDHRLQGLMVAGAGVGAALVSQRYSREAELEADYYGTLYMARAGYDPAGAVSLQERFVRLADAGERNWLEGLFASHPPSRERVRRNQETAEALYGEHPDRDWILGGERYAEKVEPLHRTREAYAAHDRARQALIDGQPDKSLALVERALEAYEREPAFHGLRGQALARLGQKREAEAALDQAIALDDGYFAFFLERGRLLQERGEAQSAREDLERANALLPTAPGHLALGELAEADGAMGEALENYRLAAESDSSYGRRAAAAVERLKSR